MYAKVFSSLWRGSLRGRSDPQHVFIYLLAHADEDGAVEAMPEAISDETGLSLERVRAAIEHLESPDPESRTPTNEGRRISRLDEHRSWSWIITNYEFYRRLSDREKVREQTRERVRRFRERTSTVTQGNDTKRAGNASNDKVEGRRQKVEDRGQKTEAKTPSVSLPPSSVVEPQRVSKRRKDSCPAKPDGFDEWYEQYPRKEARKKAMSAYARLSEKDRAAAMNGVMRAKGTAWLGKDLRFVPLPATYLNGRRWEDEYLGGSAGLRKGPGAVLQELGRRMKEAENG